MIDWHFVLAISCLLGAIVLGLSLAWHNARDTKRQEANLEARRAYKREKNRRLARFYGIDLDKK